MGVFRFQTFFGFSLSLSLNISAMFDVLSRTLGYNIAWNLSQWNLIWKFGSLLLRLFLRVMWVWCLFRSISPVGYHKWTAMILLLSDNCAVLFIEWSEFRDYVMYAIQSNFRIIPHHPTSIWAVYHCPLATILSFFFFFSSTFSYNFRKM